MSPKSTRIPGYFSDDENFYYLAKTGGLLNPPGPSKLVAQECLTGKLEELQLFGESHIIDFVDGELIVCSHTKISEQTRALTFAYYNTRTKQTTREIVYKKGRCLA